MDRLIVKNFGPLKDVDIELNKINLFIGENGSGKSVLAKIITIILNFSKSKENDMLKKFKEYNINYISENSIISFYSEDKLIIELKNKNFFLNQNIKKIKEQLQAIKPDIEYLISTFSDHIHVDEIFGTFEESSTFKQVYQMTSQYIPAERNFVTIISKSLSSFIVADIPLPKFFLRFASEFEKAGNELKELEFLNVKYVNGDGLDRHNVYFNDKDYLPLEFSSSGIQSALPLYLTVKYFADRHSSIIIEEPEQNLFPKAQAETIKYIVEQVSGKNNLFLMTHSPYVLSTLNNLIFAYKVAQISEKTKEQVKDFIKEEQWINPDEFSAYYLEDGVAKNIVSKRGLISDNEIDNISDEMGDEFDTLMEIYREFKYAK
ncbi:hypothetical protein MNB_SV-14-188 [hydrothermal vent metagenome]|uniref:Endonuclease GajA/Old nuclease/RecF-like AAA domain-containing protein n=1 Tax=hydrothermal vent metagenome TaxID=652676 RepID=A0A1W1BQU7_9ZZZZ